MALRLPGRLVHPPPSENLIVHLNVQALRLKLRPNRTCGPRARSTPGHWIHIDCNEYQALTTAKPPGASARRCSSFAGLLKLDSAVSSAGIPDGVDHRTGRHRGPGEGSGAGRFVHGVLAVERDG